MNRGKQDASPAGGKPKRLPKKDQSAKPKWLRIDRKYFGDSSYLDGTSLRDIPQLDSGLELEGTMALRTPWKSVVGRGHQMLFDKDTDFKKRKKIEKK